MSSLVACRVCNSQLADDAPVCPNCGTAGPKQKGKAKLIKSVRLIAGFIVIILLAYIWFVLVPEIRLHGLFYKTS